MWPGRDKEEPRIAEASGLYAWKGNGGIKNIGQSVGKYVLAR